MVVLFLPEDWPRANTILLGRILKRLLNMPGNENVFWSFMIIFNFKLLLRGNVANL